jgi:hypothetical protein
MSKSDPKQNGTTAATEKFEEEMNEQERLEKKYGKVNDFDETIFGKANLDAGYFNKKSKPYKSKRAYGKSMRPALQLLKEAAEARAKEDEEKELNRTTKEDLEQMDKEEALRPKIFNLEDDNMNFEAQVFDIPPEEMEESTKDNNDENNHANDEDNFEVIKVDQF